MKMIGSSIKTELTLIIISIMAVPLIAVVVISNLMSTSRDTGFVVQYNEAKAGEIEADISSVLNKNVYSLIAFALLHYTLNRIIITIISLGNVLQGFKLGFLLVEYCIEFI